MIVEPDSRRVEVWVRGGEGNAPVPAAADGAVASEVLDVTFRTGAGTEPRLEAADRREPGRRAAI